jgi:lipoprotein-anchoring transpeptidase ErfK/SrfK
MNSLSISRRVVRFAVTGALAAAFMAAGYSTRDASAAVNARGSVVVPVPKPGPAKREFLRGKIVEFDTTYAAGSVVVLSRAKRLYLVLGGRKAVEYRIATAKRGFEWAGTHRVSAKVKWPTWAPPAEMRKRRPELPGFMDGGPENPLGARAIYLGSSLYRIHGTNEPASIGRAASSGCIRMLNQDVSELYSHVKLGALVVVM